MLLAREKQHAFECLLLCRAAARSCYAKLGQLLGVFSDVLQSIPNECTGKKARSLLVDVGEPVLQREVRRGTAHTPKPLAATGFASAVRRAASKDQVFASSNDRDEEKQHEEAAPTCCH